MYKNRAEFVLEETVSINLFKIPMFMAISIHSHNFKELACAFSVKRDRTDKT